VTRAGRRGLTGLDAVDAIGLTAAFVGELSHCFLACHSASAASSPCRLTRRSMEAHVEVGTDEPVDAFGSTVAMIAASEQRLTNQ